MPSNNSFKRNLLRYTSNMAGKACHVAGSATQVGSTQALGPMIPVSDRDALALRRIKQATIGCWIVALALGLVSGASRLLGYDALGQFLLLLVWIAAVAFTCGVALSLAGVIVLILSQRQRT